MRKRAPAVTLLAALTASLGACDDESKTQRDVYSGATWSEALERCVADWGNEELCQKRLDDAEQRALAQQNSGGSHGGSNVFIFGPGYSGERYVSYGGQQYVPRSTGSVATSNFTTNSSGAIRPASFSAPRPAFTGTPSVSPSSVSRGGFGGTASSSSGGGAS